MELLIFAAVCAAIWYVSDNWQRQRKQRGAAGLLSELKHEFPEHAVNLTEGAAALILQTYMSQQFRDVASQYDIITNKISLQPSRPVDEWDQNTRDLISEKIALSIKLKDILLSAAPLEFRAGLADCTAIEVMSKFAEILSRTRAVM